MRCELVVVALLACAGERRELVDPSAWETMRASEDPFDDRPPGVLCAPTGLTVEVDELGRPVFEVATGLCPYVTVRQTSLARVARGARLEATLSHGPLDAGAPAVGHAVVQVGDVVVLDLSVDIPAEPGEATVGVPVDRPIPVGAPVLFHVHNHGANTWTLVDVTTGPDPG